MSTINDRLYETYEAYDANEWPAFIEEAERLLELETGMNLFHYVQLTLCLAHALQYREPQESALHYFDSLQQYRNMCRWYAKSPEHADELKHLRYCFETIGWGIFAKRVEEPCTDSDEETEDEEGGEETEDEEEEENHGEEPENDKGSHSKTDGDHVGETDGGRHSEVEGEHVRETDEGRHSEVEGDHVGGTDEGRHNEVDGDHDGAMERKDQRPDVSRQDHPPAATMEPGALQALSPDRALVTGLMKEQRPLLDGTDAERLIAAKDAPIGAYTAGDGNGAHLRLSKKRIESMERQARRAEERAEERIQLAKKQAAEEIMLIREHVREDTERAKQDFDERMEGLKERTEIAEERLRLNEELCRHAEQRLLAGQGEGVPSEEMQQQVASLEQRAADAESQLGIERQRLADLHESNKMLMAQLEEAKQETLDDLSRGIS